MGSIFRRHFYLVGSLAVALPLHIMFLTYELLVRDHLPVLPVSSISTWLLYGPFLLGSLFALSVSIFIDHHDGDKPKRLLGVMKRVFLIFATGSVALFVFLNSVFFIRSSVGFVEAFLGLGRPVAALGVFLAAGIPFCYCLAWIYLKGSRLFVGEV